MASRWEVTCPAFTAGPFRSQDVAERKLAEIERDGHCGFEHEVREVER